MAAEQFNTKIFLQFSFPKYKKATNFQPLKKSEHFDVLDYIQKELKDIGINCNVYESDISRLDNFTNIYTDEKFFSYTSLLELLQASRKKSIEWNGETYLWKSAEHQITIYDKIQELISKIKLENLSKKIVNSNVMRIENRFTTGRRVFNKLGFKNVFDLMQNFDTARQVHKQDIEQTIFKYEDNKIELLTSESLIESLQNFYNTSRRYWFRDFMVYSGYLSLIKLTSPEMILNAIDKIEMNGSTSKIRVLKHRLKKYFESAKLGSALMESNFLNSTKSNKQLYEEIKNKFLRAA